MSDHKQPQGLMMLFFAEMWERFSFYGMRALLTLYLTLELFKDMQDPAKSEHAFGIYAAYGALVYATPYIGGIIADKIIGFKRATMLGAVLMAIGHFTMAIENEPFLYISLAFLIAGNGMFKPNISSMVGGLYKDKDDPRRDAGFTIFYMGINLGALLSPLACGFIGETYGWSYGFGLAGIGMLAGLITFQRGQGVLGKNGDPTDLEKIQKPMFAGLSQEKMVYIGSFLSVAIFAFLIQYYHIVKAGIPFFAGGVMLVLFVQSFLLGSKEAKHKIWVILILLVFTTFFWAFFEQAGSSMTLFTNEVIDRTVFGWEIPTSLFQSVNAAFIVIFASSFSAMWMALADRGKEPRTAIKMAIGLALLGAGFLIMSWGGANSLFIVGDKVMVPLMFIILGYLLHTFGELCLSPVGLSMVTKLAPKHMMANVFGAWFLSSALGHVFAGIIATMTKAVDTSLEAGQNAINHGLIKASELSQKSPEVISAMDNLAGYVDVFWQIGIFAVGLGVLLLMLSPIIKKWMHGIH